MNKNCFKLEEKIIVSSLLADLIDDSLKNLGEQIQYAFGPNKELEKKEYYAIHFENIQINFSRQKTKQVFVAYGIDLEMQKQILGSWIKPDSEHDYKFWSRVCKDLKISGVSSLQLKSFDDYYWLAEASAKVFD